MNIESETSKKSQKSFLPTLTAILSVVGVITIYAAQYLYADKYSVLEVIAEQLGDGAATEPAAEASMGPPSVTITSDSTILGIFVAGGIFCAAAMFIGYRRYKSGDHSHATAAGFTIGALGLVWLAKIIVGGVS